jgi:metal-responsive CopG/Arc/MetJ family transcriptional regulator
MAKKRADSRKGMVVTTIALDKDLHEALERVSFEDKVALTELVRQAVRSWLAGRRKVRKR